MRSIANVATIVFILTVSVVQPVASGAQSNKQYLTQEMVDTSIMRGFILLNESAEMLSVGRRHQHSITEAKKIVRSLREMAKGDLNERYILWKAGELEAQIYLEESDLVMQQMRQRQLTINELVDKYNTEVGKWRPDFATLYRIHKNMEQVDAGKAGELADSYNQRTRAISREAVYFLEKALLAGNVDEARKELGYCLRNRLYLHTSNSNYMQLEDKVEGLLHAIEAKPRIEAAAASAARLLDSRNIAAARRTLDTASNLLATVKTNLPQREAIAMSSLLSRASGRLGSIEDSIVNVNVSILRSQGVEAADAYLQKTLRPLGVCHEKAAAVDRMIISTRSPEDHTASAPIAMIDNDESAPASPVLDDIMLAARKKAQIKMDSMQAIENERLARERREQYRVDSIAAIERAARLAAQRSGEQRADSLAMAIYTLIERNDIAAARSIYGREKPFLKRFLSADGVTMLSTAIDQFAAAPPKAAATVTYIKPVDSGTRSASKSSHKSAAAASSLPAQTRPAGGQPVSSSSQPTQVASAAPLHAEKTNFERAQEEIMGIYGMLENNMIDKAYRRFQINRAPLQKYLAPEAFSMLEMSVRQAYEYYSSNR